MLLKFLLVVLLLGLLVSLGSGFYFLMMDRGEGSKRRLLHSLGVRIALASTLMLLIIYGVSSGKLRSQAPWEQSRVVPAAAVPEAAATDGEK